VSSQAQSSSGAHNRDVARPAILPKRLLLLLASATATAIGLGVGVASLRDRRWVDLEARVAELTPGEASPPLPRVPLGRPLLPGNAWDDYLRIGSGSFLKLPPGNSIDSVADPEKLKSLIELNAGAIKLLRSGVRRETARAPAPVMPPGEIESIGYLGPPIVELFTLCLAQARQLEESGNLREALELLLDVYLCVRDFCGTRLMKVPVWGFWPMEASLRQILELSRKLDSSMLRDLDRQLSVLDEYFPDTSGEVLDDLLHLGELFVQEDKAGEVLLHFAPERIRRHWRYFYSSRLESAARFALADDLVREALAKKDLPWTAAEPAIWDLENRLEALKDPVLKYYLHLNMDTFRARTKRTYLRMIRIAVHYQATGQILEIDNAQGGQIGTRLMDGSLLIWNERPPKPVGVESPVQQPYVESLLIEIPIRK
jgi:hypothetical protein